MAAFGPGSYMLLCCLVATLVQRGSLSAADAVVPGISELSRLDRLPLFRDSVFVGSVSSYDRTGGNDDGFSGKYSFVAKEDGGLGDRRPARARE